MRSAGMSLSPFNAWVVLKGLETLSIRMREQSARALELARWLEQQPQVERVYHPSLPSHPQHELAMRAAERRRRRGGVVRRQGRRRASAARANAFAVIDATRICSITANLGDTKTTITHPASTSHGRLTEAQRLAAGITQGMIRIAVGLEDLEDLKADLARGLDAFMTLHVPLTRAHDRSHPLRAVAHRLPAPRHSAHRAVLVGLSRATTAGSSCCASKTPTSSVRRRRRSTRSSRRCTGSASTTTKARSTRCSAWTRYHAVAERHDRRGHRLPLLLHAGGARRDARGAARARREDPLRRPLAPRARQDACRRCPPA